MNAKEEMIKGVMLQGYDLITACGLVTKTIDEFKASGNKSANYSIGKYSFTLKRK